MLNWFLNILIRDENHGPESEDGRFVVYSAQFNRLVNKIRGYTRVRSSTYQQQTSVTTDVDINSEDNVFIIVTAPTTLAPQDNFRFTVNHPRVTQATVMPVILWSSPGGNVNACSVANVANNAAGSFDIIITNVGNAPANITYTISVQLMELNYY